jgi:hypothetical protein
VAPAAGILLDQGSQLLGSLHAARVEIGAAVTFRHHRYQEPLKIDPVCVSALEEALKTPAGGQWGRGQPSTPFRTRRGE